MKESKTARYFSRGEMWLLTCLLLIPCTRADDSGLKAFMSQKGLQKVTHYLTNWLQKELGSIKIPEFRGGVDIVLGTVYYVLHDMSIVRCDLPEPSVVFSEGTGISLQITGLSLAISGQWNTNFGIIHDGGGFNLAVYNINLNTVLELGNDNGHLSVSTLVCSASVGSVNADFYGGGSFIFQPFVDMFRGRIAGEISEKICPSLKNVITDIEARLAATSEALRLDQYVYMNISLTDSPVFTDQGINLNVMGEVYSINSPSEPPFSSNYFELPTETDYMLTLGVSEFSLNSAAFAYQEAGVLQKVTTEDMIPKASPFHLNTSQFGKFIPQLPKFFPNMSMEILLYADKTPLVFLNETVANIRVITAAKFMVVKTDSEKIPVFTLNTECAFSAKASIQQQTIKGYLELKNFTLTLGSTEIGVFSTDPIENMVKFAMTTVILPKVNSKLKEGLPLPTVKGFSLQNSVMMINNGFLTISTDVATPFGKQ